MEKDGGSLCFSFKWLSNSQWLKRSIELFFESWAFNVQELLCLLYTMTERKEIYN